jgi:hypothetical protein
LLNARIAFQMKLMTMKKFSQRLFCIAIKIPQSVVKIKQKQVLGHNSYFQEA